MEQVAQGINPARFGRYILLDKLGNGGMAEVFRAIMPGAEGFQRTLVVKRILPRFSESARFVEMFVREARIGAMLNHPNIVQVYDFGSFEGQYFLAMEYLRGRDVLAVIRRLCELKRPFPVPLAAFIAHEVARCLAYAHALTGPDGQPLDIVHRDVSPANIMCLREGGVKLLDFGIAKAAGELAPDDARKNTLDGKLAYLSPESLRRQPVDGRSDLYAVGVVLWEMLTCRRLFPGRDEAETLRNVLEMPVPPPSSRRPDVSARLDAIVLRALARDPAARYASGQALADDLELVLRESGFKSSMLPQLLVDLFGSGLRSSQIALSCVPPEMLAEASQLAILASGSGSISGSLHSIDAARPKWRSRAVLGSAVGAAILGGFLGLFAWRAKAPDVSPPKQLTPAPAAAAEPVPVATPAPETAPPAAPPATPPAKVVGGVAPAPATPASIPASRPAGVRRKSTGTRPRSTGDPISGGLSIDPFAEASAKGGR